FEVARPGRSEPVRIRVPPQPFRSLGLVMDIEPIVAIKEGSPAEQAGLKVGDKILRVNGRDVGQELNPLRLPDLFASLHGQNVKVEVKREVESGTTEDVTLHVVPENRPGWVEKPFSPGVPLSIPAIGVAYHLIPTVLRIEPGSPADGKLREGDLIKKVELVLPEGTEPDGFEDEKGAIPIEIGGDEKNWAFAFWMMQLAARRDVRLTVSREGQLQEVLLTPQPAKDWYLPNRGLRLEPLTTTLKADSFVQAVAMGVRHTKNSLLDIYLTLRNLIGGLLSYKELHGPIGIARVAYEVSKEGLSKLLLFLGFLSVNLAVLNFLPIPVLDGGHMIFLAWEGIVRKRPSERVMVAATYFGMAFVLGLMLLVIYLDIFVHRLGID
ncbi:MAG: PDZ domain-containing protein, partial [Planctomycetes bacterium]|nr:PDZ domain-containing protein [Planctomycetota bacterium]